MATHSHPTPLRCLVAAIIAAVLSAGILLSPTGAAPVHAATADSLGAEFASTEAVRAARTQREVTATAVRVAMHQRGDRYRYGASGPHAFDCSGLVMFSFGRAGQVVPRTSSEQARATRRIPSGNARRGDLVFFYDRGGVYHVGIYLGDHRILHAPRTGEVVGIDEIWTTKVFFGRVR